MSNMWKAATHFYEALWCCCSNNSSHEEAPVTEKSGLLSKSAQSQSGHRSTSKSDPSRAFVIAKHARHGYLLLVAFKKQKGRHCQIPGGHVDDSDASVMAAAARELYEETGIDLRAPAEMQRLKLVVFPSGGVQHHARQFFRLELQDSDALGSHKPETGENFTLKLSDEHQAFRFEKEASKAAEMIRLHSGGRNREAFLKAEVD